MANTLDANTIQSTGAFLLSELERLDPVLYQPLASVTWSRDITLRSDVSMADEVSSFANVGFSGVGGAKANGKNWIGNNTTAIAGVSIDLSKTNNPLYAWGMEVGYSIMELMASMQVNRPIDDLKIQALNLKYQMDIDEMVYVGDKDLGVKGLLNSANVGVTQNVPTGAGASDGKWKTKSEDEILTDINNLIVSVWEKTGYTVLPNKILLPPQQFADIVKMKVSSAGERSILTYIKENNIAKAQGNIDLEINAVKWAKGIGTSGADRMIAYNNNSMYVRYPLVPLQRTPIEYHGIHQKFTYYGKLGVVESPYPTTIGYADGI